MSKILKGLTEANPHNYDSDWDYQDAVASSGRSRSSYRSQEDDTSDADIAYSKKMYQLGQKQKAAKEKAQRDADHDRLASGTNEGMMPLGGTSTTTDRRKVMDLLQVYYKSMGGDFWEWFNQPGNKEFFAKRAEVSPDSAYEVVDSINWGQHPEEEWPKDEEEQLNELSNKKLGKYKTAAGADASKADSEGDYKRADKRFSGIVKATKKQFNNDTKTVKEDINVVYKKAKQLLTQLDENTQQRVINALKKRVVKEFEGDMETVTAPTTNKPPRQTFSIVLQGKPPKDFEARFAWAALQNVFPNDYPPGSEKAEWKIVEVSRKGSAIIKSGINNRDIAETLVAKLVKNKVPAPCLKIISSELDEADEKPAEPFKSTYPRVNNPKILGTQNRAKSIYHPPSKPNVKKLDKPLPESLGNELKSKSLEALQQVKQKLEQQRMAELEQWEKDFKQNTVSKFTAREPNLRQRATSTPMVAMPGEKHSELKTRLSQLNKAIEKQGILDNLVQKLDKKGLMTPNIEAGVDTSMLARDGARDNYVELNSKLDKALEYVKNRLLTNKAAYAKPKAIDEEQLDELSCWSGYHRVAGTKAGFPGSCAKNKTNEEEIDEINRRGFLKGLGAGAAAGYIGKKINDTEVYVVKGYGGTSVSVYATSPEDAINNVLNDKTYNPALFKNATATLIPRTEIEKQDQINKSYDKKLNPDELRQRLHNISVGDPDFSVRRWIGSPDSVRKHQVNGTEYQFWYYNGGLSLDFFDGKLQAIHKSNKMILKDSESCPHCGGEMVSEELMNEKKDACYYKVKSRYKVWPSAYASGALVKCRNKGASNWGNGGKKNESSILEGIERADESLHDWFNKEKWVRMDTKGKIKGPCAREPGEGKPKCLPQAKAHSLGKKGRASAAQRKRREDPNPERSGKAINVNTKKNKG